MQLRYLKSITGPSDGPMKVYALAWSPNNKRLAVCTADRVVGLYNDKGERMDKFITKSLDKKAPRTYVVRAMAWSPDSTKLAVAQSDNVVFVYKLGLEWGDRKTICNIFKTAHSPVTALTWPSAHPTELVFGLAEGKVRIGQLGTNKSVTAYNGGSYVTALCSGPDGHTVLSGHLDGLLCRFSFSDAASFTKFAVHSSPPYALDWGRSICAAGADYKVTFYNDDGSAMRTFDYEADVDSGAAAVKEFTVAAFNPSGESVVVGNFDSFYSYTWAARRGQWEELPVKRVENMYSVTALAWKPDGSRLAVGSLCGSVDSYDACVRRYRYRGQFEFTYVSLSQVIVKRIETGKRIVLKSHYGREILKIDIFQDRFIIAHTSATLLVGDTETRRLSELTWAGSSGMLPGALDAVGGGGGGGGGSGGAGGDDGPKPGKGEKYIFDNPSVCMVYRSGELTLIEYGDSEPLGVCRTDYVSPHLISVRVNEREPSAEEVATGRTDSKKIAYLLDPQTVVVKDLVEGYNLVSYMHPSNIDWLELNWRASWLLFRDKKRQLHLYSIADQERKTLLTYCQYVQWVPRADVVVAQSTDTLCVWYNINAPDKMTTTTIKGDIEEIERSEGTTSVRVDEGLQVMYYELDESLIQFGGAVDDRDFERALDILEELEMEDETEAMWVQLRDLSLDVGHLPTAERCAAALGNVAQARYLHEVIAMAESAEDTLAGSDGYDHWQVRARLAMLQRDFAQAERIYLEQGQVDEAIEMWQMLHRFDQAIRVAESKGRPEAEDMKREYFSSLLASGQEEKAARMKEAEGDYVTAVNLFLKGGLPAKAAAVIAKHAMSYRSELLEKVATSLSAAGMHEKAGELYTKMEQPDAAMESFLRGHAYRRAVELARLHFPSRLVQLQTDWGEWLFSQKHYESAYNHFAEARLHERAVDSAIKGKMYAKASALLGDLPEETAAPYYRVLAAQYESNGLYEEAERLYVRADEPRSAVDMYTKNNRWEDAHRVAKTYMTKDEVEVLYVSQAHRLEAAMKLKEAEHLYLFVEQPDGAIDMYKKHRRYEDMVRLVKTYRPDLLRGTHLHLAQQLEMETQYKEAEHHYVEAGEWQSAVSMYRANNMWEEAIAVARFFGGVAASKKVAYAWAVTLGGEAGAMMLAKQGLIEQALDYALESGAFEEAFELARNSLKEKLPEVHLRHALYLEDENNFREAEEEYINAGKPKEAVLMYTHLSDWMNAMRVAEAHAPASIPTVLIKQAKPAVKRREFSRAEELYLQAKRPDLALAMYETSGSWDSAMRIARVHLPTELPRVEAAMAAGDTSGGLPRGGGAAGGDGGRAVGGSSGGGGGGSAVGGAGAAGGGTAKAIMAQARLMQTKGNYAGAIDAYLSLKASHFEAGDERGAEEAWRTAAKLAQNYEPTRHGAVVDDIAARLSAMKRYSAAAALLKDVEHFAAAVRAYMAGNMWDKARALAEVQVPDLVPEVEAAYQHALKDGLSGEALVKEGMLADAADVFMQRGEWDRVFETAAKVSPALLHKYTVTHTEHCLDDGRAADAIAVLSKHGAPARASQLPLYQRLVSMTMAATAEEEAKMPDTTLPALRDVLFNVVNTLQHSGDCPAATMDSYQRLLMVTHFTSLRAACEAAELDELAAKLSVSLLRYTTDYPADKAFFIAGRSCRAMGWDEQAFVFMNRYLDLSDAIEEKALGLMDNSDFEDTDIPPPFDCPLPDVHYPPEDELEEAREWVLSISMGRSVFRKLRTRTCSECSKDVYEAGLTCPYCNTQFPACIVSGMPVPESRLISCSACGSNADRTSWNQYVTKCKTCPWCASVQSPIY